MPTVHFATTNKEKLIIAQIVCSQFAITVEQAKVEIDEIQGENPKIIIEDKARRAYEKLSKPVVVSDDFWDIPALKGFPGPYMKSINQWFTPEDFLRLMHGIQDRSIILRQHLAYFDGNNIQLFKNDIHGQVTHEARGKHDYSQNMTVVVLDHDNGKTIAEVFDQGPDAVMERYRTRRDAWHEFVDWYKTSDQISLPTPPRL